MAILQGVYVLAPGGTRCVVQGCTSMVRHRRGEGGWVSFGGPKDAPTTSLIWCPRCAKEFRDKWEDATDYDAPLVLAKGRSVTPK